MKSTNLLDCFKKATTGNENYDLKIGSKVHWGNGGEAGNNNLGEGHITEMNAERFTFASESGEALNIDFIKNDSSWSLTVNGVEVTAIASDDCSFVYYDDSTKVKSSLFSQGDGPLQKAKIWLSWEYYNAQTIYFYSTAYD